MRAALLATAESRRFAACLALSLGVHAGGFLAAAQWQVPATTGAAGTLTVTLRNDGATTQLAAPAEAPNAGPVARADDPAPPASAVRNTGAGGRQPKETPPEPLAQITPQFPESAFIQGIVAGRVELEASVDEEGRVDSVRIVASSVSDVFNASALAAIRATRFKPATLAGIPVRSTIRPVIVYDLGEKTAER